MSLKSIIVGSFGQIVLSEELLKHLKIRPGSKLNCRRLPGNKLLLETVESDNEDIENISIKSCQTIALSDKVTHNYAVH